MSIEDAISFWSEADALPRISHLDGVVAIADTAIDNRLRLRMYTEDEFIAWMSEAKEGLEIGYFDYPLEAVQETYREPDSGDDH